MIKANLVHLGMNIGTAAQASDPLACDRVEWTKITDHMCERGLNMCVIDLNEGVMYQSHPEIAVKGAWSVARLRGELARLRALGMEPIPKLNFSAAYDQWLGDWHRMVATPEYYKVCEDLIAEVYEIFGKPRFFHLGYRDENAQSQAANENLILRQGALWWHDFLWFTKVVEKQGTRPWVWGDHVWGRNKDEFLRRCPKSVVVSNWSPEGKLDEQSPYVQAFCALDKAGFDQIPAVIAGESASQVASTVDFCHRNLTASRRLGFVQASWRRCLPECRAANLAAIDQLVEALS